MSHNVRIKINELRKTVELPAMQPKGNPDFLIPVRIEVFEDGRRGDFYPLVWFRESYRIQPTAPLVDPTAVSDDTLGDEEILTLQESLGFDEIRGGSVDEVLQRTLSRVTELLEEYQE